MEKEAGILARLTQLNLKEKHEQMSERSTIPNHSSCLSLLTPDYCTIEEAAQILCCTVVNIMHWGAEGYIPLMVNFDHWVQPTYGKVSHYLGDSLKPDENGIVVLAGGQTWYRNVLLTDSDDDEIIELDELGGFWCVLESDVYKSRIGVPLDEIKLIAPNIDFIPTGSSEALAMAFDIENPFPTYWISGHSLLRLQEQIRSNCSGQLIPDPMLVKPDIQKAGKVHGNTAINAEKRQRIIDAVTNLLKQGKLHGISRSVIPPFLGAFKSRGHAACARRCFGV
ncbi:hypothetical protein WP2S18C03_31040 [Aeromonas veronii]|nr:hypothetical protein WP2S18C03_31040 [Aeromonas veronii]